MDEKPGRPDSESVRAARFGRLPARIHPSTTVETVATSSPPGRPEAAGIEELRQAIHDGG